METKKILLIEDNEDDIELVKLSIDSVKILNSMDIVRDGEEAVEYLFCTGQYSTRNPEDYPSVILLDLKLPKISGLEVLEKIRSNIKTKSLPVVIFTSSNQEKDIIKGYELGANSYIQKPVDFDKFKEAIQQLNLYWIILNTKPII